MSEKPVEELVCLDEWFQANQEDFMGHVSGSSSVEVFSPMRSVVEGSHFDDYLASPQAMLTLCDRPGQMQSPFGSLDNGKDDLAFLGDLPFLDNAMAHTETNSDTGTVVSTNTNTPQSRPIESGASCMDRAMDLLKELSPNTMSLCSSSRDLDSPSAGRTTRDIIATNKRIIDAVISILGCSCSRDGYLLSILLMIVLRTLDGYTAAARMGVTAAGRYSAVRSRSSLPYQASPGSATTKGSSVDRDEDPRHMAAQHVLSELHHMQRLAKQLSEKMDEQIQQRGAAGRVQGLSAGESALSEDETHFSSNTWNQLDAELKQKLKSLSGGIISMLRGE
ncbi:hypothetical protein TruAng_010558 [Truncatella angustata]|nr:hypothetical protein TruAng_010558 [Truncatella angustata]